jgi:hypothetical protein
MFTEREVSMIRAGLRDRAEAYRKLAKSRQYEGDTFAHIRANALAEARAYDALAFRLRLSRDGGLTTLPR